MNKSKQTQFKAVATTQQRWESEYLLLLYVGALLLCALAMLAQHGVNNAGKTLSQARQQAQAQYSYIPIRMPHVDQSSDSVSTLALDAADVDSDTNIDWLTIEIPTPLCARLNFRLVDTLSQADESVYSVAIPRSIPMAIP